MIWGPNEQLKELRRLVRAVEEGEYADAEEFASQFRALDASLSSEDGFLPIDWAKPQEPVVVPEGWTFTLRVGRFDSEKWVGQILDDEGYEKFSLKYETLEEAVGGLAATVLDVEEAIREDREEGR